MLKSVGNPYALNPIKELLQLLRLDDTISDALKIVVGRKDRIYQ